MTLPKPRHDTRSIPAQERLDPGERVDPKNMPPSPYEQLAIPPEGERDSDRNRMSLLKRMGIGSAALLAAIGGYFAVKGNSGNSTEPQSRTSVSAGPTAGETSPTVELPPPTQADLINVKYNDYTDEQRAILEQPIRKTETENRTAEEAGASFWGIYSGIVNSGEMEREGSMCKNCQYETEESQAALENQLVAAFGSSPYSESVQGVIEQARKNRLGVSYYRFTVNLNDRVDKNGDKFWVQSSAQLLSSTSVDNTTTTLNYHYTRDNNLANYPGGETLTREAHVEQDVTITMQLGADGVWRVIEMV